MEQTINNLFQKGKGLLAMDESIATMNLRLRLNGCPETKKLREGWREFLLTNPNLKSTISGVILFEETLFGSLKDGSYFVSKIKEQDIEIGIKVDQGLIETVNKEQHTVGLDSLAERLIKYKNAGAVFTKWRSVFKISAITPSPKLIDKNTDDLVKYAKIVLENKIIPVLEPEILMEGAHSIEEQKQIFEKILKILFQKLKNNNLNPKHCVLKTGFVVQGKKLGESSADIVAKETLDLFQRILPKDLGGVVFLSGGLSTQNSFAYLQETMKQKAEFDIPFPISFSYGRALQQDPLKELELWRGW